MFNKDYIIEKVGKHPIQGVIWKGFSDEERENYIDYLTDLINNHKWKGIVYYTPYQEVAFPRIIDCQLIYWDQQDNSLPPINHLNFEGEIVVLPVFWIVETVIKQLEQKDFQKQKTLKEIGLDTVKVGPLESKFDVTNKEKIHLPQPLWDNLRQYSLLDTQSVPFLTGDILRK